MTQTIKSLLVTLLVAWLRYRIKKIELDLHTKTKELEHKQDSLNFYLDN